MQSLLPTTMCLFSKTIDNANIAAEARAKIIYERLINVTADPGIKEALGFLMTREIAHQKSF
ncbi:MAG: Mn-containing catalase, partial [Caballeronia sp.]|nr:Mn-containing catalase [Caballeronia sp.]